MKIYLAARTRHTEKLLQIAEFLIGQGHEIISDWIYVNENLKPFSEHEARVQEIASHNVEQMLKSDMLILFNDVGGKDTFTEFGVCLGASVVLDKNFKLYCVGKKEEATILQFHSKVRHCLTFEELFGNEGIDYRNFSIPNME